MARHGVSIVKQVLWRGVQQEFANVYHYEGGTLDQAQADALIDSVKANEVSLHATDVTFIRGACWTAGGSPGSNNMVSQKLLTGTGNQTPIANMSRELAFLVQWPAGTDSRGHMVFLRKWYHSCGNIAANTPSSANMQGTAQLGTTLRNAVAAAAALQETHTINSIPRTLCAASGRAPTSGAQCYIWLEHHQLGDMWR